MSAEVPNEWRRRAVKLRLSGMKLKDIVARVDLAKSTILRAVAAYEQGDWKALGVEKHGRPTGSGRRLTAEQKEQVQAWIRDTTPDQMKLSFALWTREAVAELVEQKLSISRPVRTLAHYLKR